MSVQVEARTYTSREVCRLVGISYRQLDYWERSGLIESSIREANGSGYVRHLGRLFSAEDVDRIWAISKLTGGGLSLRVFRSRSVEEVVTDLSRLLQTVAQGRGEDR